MGPSLGVGGSAAASGGRKRGRGWCQLAGAAAGRQVIEVHQTARKRGGGVRGRGREEGKEGRKTREGTHEMVNEDETHKALDH